MGNGLEELHIPGAVISLLDGLEVDAPYGLLLIDYGHTEHGLISFLTRLGNVEEARVLRGVPKSDGLLGGYHGARDAYPLFQADPPDRLGVETRGGLQHQVIGLLVQEHDGAHIGLKPLAQHLNDAVETLLEVHRRVGDLRHLADNLQFRPLGYHR